MAEQKKKKLPVFLEEEFENFKVIGINPINEIFKEFKYFVGCGHFDLPEIECIHLPKPLVEFFRDFTEYNSGMYEDPSVTKKIITRPLFLGVEIEEYGESYAGAIHSVENKRDDYSVEFRINVSKEKRSKGYGSKLLDILDQVYWDNGYTLICEFSKLNTAAKKFFERNGYVLEDEGITYKAIKEAKK